MHLFRPFVITHFNAIVSLLVAGPDVKECRHIASEWASNIAAITQTILSTVKLSVSLI
jgi:hypothetical protein